MTVLARALLGVLRTRSASAASAAYALAMAAVLAGSVVTFGISLLPAPGNALALPAESIAAGAPAPNVLETPARNAGALTPAAQNLFPWLVGAWIAGVVAMAVRLALGGIWLRRLARSARIWEDALWQGKLHDWCRQFGIPRAVRLCITTLHDAPAVIGHFKPVILLPASLLTNLTAEQLEAVILHELMHIRRHDYLLNLARLAGETIYFFNPSVWWLSRAIRLEREVACDELAAAQTGSKAGYARALLRLEELRIPEGSALALAASSGPLKLRIARLLAPAQSSPTLSGWAGLGLVALLLAGAAVLLGPRSLAADAASVKFELRSVVPSGSANAEVLAITRTNTSSGGTFTNRLTVSKRVLLENRHVASAEMAHDPIANRPEIAIKLTDEGTKLFGNITREHVGKQIAIVISGKLHSAPTVNEAITGGRLLITGDFSTEEAEALARNLSPKAAAGDKGADEKFKAPRWEPPLGSVPSQILDQARADRDAGRYEEALAKHLWYHTASRQESGQGGVRLSFALGDWLKLGQAYPPALKALRQARDETENALRAGGVDVDRFTLFMEFAGFNRVLEEDHKNWRTPQ